MTFSPPSRPRACRSRRRSRARAAGLTLIEVVASLAILGLLLAGLLLSKGRLQRQWAAADQRLAAIAAADGLLNQWHRGEGVPLNESGHIEGAGLAWRTTAFLDAEAEPLGALVVRLEVFSDREDEPQVLSTVEVLAPRPDWPPERTDEEVPSEPPAESEPES